MEKFLAVRNIESESLQLVFVFSPGGRWHFERGQFLVRIDYPSRALQSVKFLLGPIHQNLGRISRDNRQGWNILNHHTAHCHDRSLTDANARRYECARADPNI